MADKIEGYLEVGLDENLQIVINHPHLKSDEHGVGHIIFSVAQARNLAAALNKHATDAALQIQDREEAVRMASAGTIPVSRDCRELISGKPITDDMALGEAEK